MGLIKELYKKDQIKLKPTGRVLLELFNIQGEDGTVLTACLDSGCTGNLHTSDLIQNDSLHNTQLNNQVTNVAGGGQISSKSYILLLPHEQTDRHKYLECQLANVDRIVSDVTKVNICSLIEDIHKEYIKYCHDNNKEASFDRTNLPDSYGGKVDLLLGYPTFRPSSLRQGLCSQNILSSHP